MSITFDLGPNDDAEITCVVCGSWKCDLGFQTQGNGKRSWFGVHSKCADKYNAIAAERERVFRATVEASLLAVFSAIGPNAGGAIHMRDVRRVLRALTIGDIET